MCSTCKTKPLQSVQSADGVNLDKLQITSETTLSKRQVRKAITSNIALKLLELNSPLHKEYIRTLNCGSAVTLLSNNTTKAWYCGKRWCTVCNNIKQAELIEAYLPSLQSMAEPFFVTLTVPRVSGVELSETIKKMGKTFTQIKDRLRKKGYILSGIRKIEANYCEKKKNYNPHYHIIIDGAEESVLLVQNWLKDNPNSSYDGQNITPADTNSLKELFKYQAKIVMKSKFNAEATDTIMKALKGVRTYQNFGNVKKASVIFDNDKGAVVTLSDTDKPVQAKNDAYPVGFYLWEKDDWYTESGISLSGAELPKKVLNLIEHIRGKPKIEFCL